MATLPTPAEVTSNSTTNDQMKSYWTRVLTYLSDLLGADSANKAAARAALGVLSASTEREGLVELATIAEVQAGTDNTRAVTPAGLASRTATETRAGIVELATAAEVQAGTDNSRAVTPAGLASRLGASVPGTAAVLGDGVDLNTIQTPGFYVQPLDVQAASGTNYPIAYAGALVVLKNAGGVTQIYCTYGQQTRLFFRSFYSVYGWSTWREVYHSGNLGDATLSFRNKLINAAFTVNQRGYASGAATTAANQYTLDRWRVVTSGQALSWSGAAPNITITAPAGGVEQVIEGIWIEGGTYTLSWTGTATATINGSAVANGGQVTLTAGANATVRFSGGTVSKPQLELGSYATRFELRPAALELMLCQRYFWKPESSILVQGHSNAAGANAFQTVLFPARMRATPTVTATFSGAVNATGSVQGISPSGFQIRATSNAAGDYAIAFMSISSASAEL